MTKYTKKMTFSRISNILEIQKLLNCNRRRILNSFFLVGDLFSQFIIIYYWVLSHKCEKESAERIVQTEEEPFFSEFQKVLEIQKLSIDGILFEVKL